ncbi:MAG: HAMP domain-containing protein [Candidatus Omnitrophica bacterium]|nr:HAMP domain-containing protein [Candidatus Omnitrophota bacterium]
MPLNRAAVYQRRQYLVDRPYQLRFVSRVLMGVLLIAVVSGFVTSTILWRNMYQPELLREHVVVGLLAVTMTLLVELLVSIPIIFVLGIQQSHRVIGPMSRLKRTLEAIGNGDLSQRITLRQGDALEDLAKSINQMAEKLQQRFPTSPSS